mmetsp:Transcript_155262/g.275367  ORF Transcript_155262/g.275367 Transcript_155262/m.275367 type:complete len:232 (+) Transcript_155262:475-1170(+)
MIRRSEIAPKSEKKSRSLFSSADCGRPPTKIRLGLYGITTSPLGEQTLQSTTLPSTTCWVDSTPCSDSGLEKVTNPNPLDRPVTLSIMTMPSHGPYCLKCSFSDSVDVVCASAPTKILLSLLPAGFAQQFMHSTFLPSTTCGAAKAFWEASGVANVQKPKPRDRPVVLSIMTMASAWPYCWKCRLRDSLVVVWDKPPTKILFSTIGPRWSGRGLSRDIYLCERQDRPTVAA